jgi:hypothetical protein
MKRKGYAGQLRDRLSKALEWASGQQAGQGIAGAWSRACHLVVYYRYECRMNGSGIL